MSVLQSRDAPKTVLGQAHFNLLIRSLKNLREFVRGQEVTLGLYIEIIRLSMSWERSHPWSVYSKQPVPVRRGCMCHPRSSYSRNPDLDLVGGCTRP